MIRLIGMLLAVWLPCQAGLADTMAQADICSSCTARHKSLQALQSARVQPQDADAPAEMRYREPHLGRWKDPQPPADEPTQPDAAEITP